MTDVVDVCNSALNQLGASTIAKLTEDSKNARIVNQRYEFVRDAVFRAHPWNCLTIRSKLTKDPIAPTFEFSNAFSLPSNPYCLRLLQLDQLDIVHRVERRKILCDESDVSILYIGKIVDVHQYDTLLLETIVAALAADVAYPIVGSISLGEQMRALYEMKLKEARFVDATEGTPASIGSVTAAGSLESDVFIRSRF